MSYFPKKSVKQNLEKLCLPKMSMKWIPATRRMIINTKMGGKHPALLNSQGRVIEPKSTSWIPAIQRVIINTKIFQLGGKDPALLNFQERATEPSAHLKIILVLFITDLPIKVEVYLLALWRRCLRRSARLSLHISPKNLRISKWC